MGFDGRIRIYPTLRCNLKCGYCVNKPWSESFVGDERGTLSVEEWAGILERADRDVIVTGGEPFLYPHLANLLNTIRRKVMVYTNLAVHPGGWINALTRPVKFRATLHPSGPPPEEFAARIRLLAFEGKFTGSIHVVDSAGAAFVRKAKAALSGKFPWPFGVLIDQRRQFREMSAGKRLRRVKCVSRNLLVGPNGVRYPCVSCLLANRLPQENLTEEPLRDEWVEVECEHWGACAPCDGLTERRLEFLDGENEE